MAEPTVPNLPTLPQLTLYDGLSTFSEAFPLWLESRLRLAPQTREDYKRYGKAIGKTFGAIPLRDVHLQMLTAYQQTRRQEVCALIVNKEIGTLLQVRRRAGITDALEELYEPLPLPHWQPPKTITDEQERLFLDALRSRPEWETVYWYALLSLKTGATGCELRGLRLGDIDLAGSHLFIRREHVKNKYRIRKLPLVASAAWAAQRLIELANAKGSIEPHHYLLPFRWATGRYNPNQPCTRSMIRKVWDAARNIAGVPDFAPHHARHQVNTKLYESGADDMTVMSLMGHQSRQMSEHYSAIRDKRKREVVEAALGEATSMEGGKHGSRRPSRKQLICACSISTRVQTLRHALYVANFAAAQSFVVTGARTFRSKEILESERRKQMQKGTFVKISGDWFVRYWEKRNVNGTVKQKRVSHRLGKVENPRAKHPPKDIQDAGEEHIRMVTGANIPAERVTTLGDFVQSVYLPWIEQHKRPSTVRGYRDIWEDHLKAECADEWIKNTRTYHVQNWLNSISKNGGLSRNSLKHIKSVVSAIFKLAKQQDYFFGENPARDTAVNPSAPEPEETHAYSLEEVNSILAHIPEPAATAFAVAAFSGLRVGEIEGLNWEDYREGCLHVSRSVWNGHVTDPKTRKSSAPVPVIRHLAARLDMNRLRSGNPESGPMFTTTKGTRQNMNNLLNRVILPELRRCGICRKLQAEHAKANHEYKLDASLPEWHGWHACRRGLGSNLYRLGVPDVVIQRILRHANVSTTTGYYIKTVADDVRGAMEKLENNIPQPKLDSKRTLELASSTPN
ncbi:MAG: site-specific integrase [Acidobacteriales bacterium]|nr:site-specific integrase [Terriglobales bacterium]